MSVGPDRFQWVWMIFSGFGQVLVVWTSFSGSGHVSVGLDRFQLVGIGFSGSGQF